MYQSNAVCGTWAAFLPRYLLCHGEDFLVSKRKGNIRNMSTVNKHMSRMRGETWSNAEQLLAGLDLFPLFHGGSGKHRFWTWLSTCRIWEPRSSWIDPGNGSPCKLETHTVDDHCHHGNQPWRWKTMGFSNGKQCWDLGMTLTSNYIPCLSDPKTRHMLNKLINAFCMLFAMWRYQHLCGQGDKSVFIRSTKDSKQYV